MLMPTPELAPSRHALADRDLFLAAAGEGAHDRGAAADVGAVADDDAGGDAALDHGGAQGAGVEVHEAFVHDGGAVGEVRAEADPVGVGDPDAGGDDVVDHPRELVHAVDGDGAAPAQPGAGQLEVLDGGGAEVGPDDVGELAEDAVEVDAVRLDQAVREQVQAQVGVGGVGRRLVEVDLDEDDFLFGAAVGVGSGGGDVGQGRVRVRDVPQVLRRGSQRRCREPHVQHGGFTVAGGDGGEPVAVGGAGVGGHSGRSGLSHASSL